MSRPGWSVTGFAVSELAMGGKRLEVLKQIAPHVSRATVIVNPKNPGRLAQAQQIEDEGPRLGIKVSATPVRSAAEIESGVRSFAAKPNGGLIVLTDFVTITHSKLIVAMAARYPRQSTARVLFRSSAVWLPTDRAG